MNPRLLLLLFIAPALALADEYQPRNTQKEGDEPPTPREALEQITVPEGFKVSLFAAEPDVRQPVAMVTDDRGRIWVAESYSYKEWQEKGEDRIVVLEDTDNDGQFDERKVFWSGGKHVSGMNVGWGGVWVCSAPHLLFIPDRNGDDIPDGEPEVVLDGWTTEAGHNFFNGLQWGIDGWLYGRHGITRPSLVGRPGTPEEERVGFDCAIWRYHPVTEAFEVVCRGTTNPWGMDWNAEGELFFTGNVNGHLWHGIPGALFPRMGNRPDANVEFDYERMPMCADHLHHAGTTDDWTKTRDGLGVHGDLGGGHSHCGGMIYLADNWPKDYFGSIFMSNTHGRRLNQNILARDQSGYVGRRAPDLFFANQPWFRGVSVLYGPDGGVYVSDWCDLGECHDNDGVHRTSGRVYKVTFGDPELPQKLDLAKASDLELAQYQWEATNEWYARKGRRILQERVAGGQEIDSQAIGGLKDQLSAQDSSTQVRIRTLLTLYVTGNLDEKSLANLLDDRNEQLRKWAVRLLVDQNAPGKKVEAKFVGKAKSEESALVRLYLASALQKLDIEDRWELASALASRKEDAEDKNLPLMVWYGIDDAMAADPVKGIAWLDDCAFDRLHRFSARLVCENASTRENLAMLLKRVETSDQSLALEVANGMAEGLEGRNDLATPANWAVAAARLGQMDQGMLASQLGMLLDRESTLADLRQRLENDKDPQALKLLIQSKAPGLADLLLASLDQEALRPLALQGLAYVYHKGTADAILSRYESLKPNEQELAIATMVSSKGNARALLDAIAAGEITRSALSAFQARQIQSMKDKELNGYLSKVWGKTGSSSGEKASQIKQYQNQLTEDILAQADLEAGKLHFTQRCAACHILFGEGGKIGPDLTGANRSDVYYLLENIIDPSATLPKDFHVTLITKKDGQLVTGNIGKETDYTITLITPQGDVIVNREEIEDQKTMPVSLMPEGLLVGLELEQIRDLLGYLMK